MRKVLSFPTVRATFPEGCTATAFTRPLCPFRARRTAQSRARKMHKEPSSDAERRYDREGKLRWVIEPDSVHSATPYPLQCGWNSAKRTFVVHQPTNFLLPPQVPDLHNLVCTPRRKPFASLWRRSDGFDTRHMGGEDEYGFEVVFELAVAVYGCPAVQSVEQFFVGPCDDFECRRELGGLFEGVVGRGGLGFAFFFSGLGGRSSICSNRGGSSLFTGTRRRFRF